MEPRIQPADGNSGGGGSSSGGGGSSSCTWWCSECGSKASAECVDKHLVINVKSALRRMSQHLQTVMLPKMMVDLHGEVQRLLEDGCEDERAVHVLHNFSSPAYSCELTVRGMVDRNNALTASWSVPGSDDQDMVMADDGVLRFLLMILAKKGVVRTSGMASVGTQTTVEKQLQPKILLIQQEPGVISSDGEIGAGGATGAGLSSPSVPPVMAVNFSGSRLPAQPSMRTSGQNNLLQGPSSEVSQPDGDSRVASQSREFFLGDGSARVHLGENVVNSSLVKSHTNSKSTSAAASRSQQSSGLDSAGSYTSATGTSGPKRGSGEDRARSSTSVTVISGTKQGYGEDRARSSTSAAMTYGTKRGYGEDRGRSSFSAIVNAGPERGYSKDYAVPSFSRNVASFSERSSYARVAGILRSSCTEDSQPKRARPSRWDQTALERATEYAASTSTFKPPSTETPVLPAVGYQPVCASEVASSGEHAERLIPADFERLKSHIARLFHVDIFNDVIDTLDVTNVGVESHKSPWDHLDIERMEAVVTLVNSLGVRVLKGVHSCDFKWVKMLLRAARPHLEDLTIMWRRGCTHILELLLRHPGPLLQRLQVTGKSMTRASMKMKTLDRNSLSSQQSGLRWIRLEFVPREWTFAMVEIHSHTLEEVELLVGTAGCGLWPLSCSDLAASLARLKLPALRRVLLRRVVFVPPETVLSVLHTPALCAIQLAAVRRALLHRKTVSVVCDECEPGEQARRYLRTVESGSTTQERNVAH